MVGETLVGQTVADRYAVLSEIGSGGFGTVYMAKHIGLNNPVALKVLHPHLVNQEEHVERFRREAEATSRLRHSAIASVFDFGLLPDKRPYMVMEFLAGNSLISLMESQGRMSPEVVVPLFVECCDALRYAHRKGLLHRDIKPDNIFVVRDMDGAEHVKLLDFGLAKMVFQDEQARLTSLTESGTVLGTPWYMSPEQCQAKPLDGRSDIYSLAYSLYEALAGRRPFPGSTPYEAMHAHLTQKPPALNPPGQHPVVPPELESVILRALAKAPNDRFTTADEFRQALMKAMPDSVFVTPINGDSAGGTGPAPAAGAIGSAGKGKGARLTDGKRASSSGASKANSQSTAVFVASTFTILVIAVSGAFAMWWHSSHQVDQAHKATLPATGADPTTIESSANVSQPDASTSTALTSRRSFPSESETRLMSTPVQQPVPAESAQNYPQNAVNVSDAEREAAARRLEEIDRKVRQVQSQSAQMQMENERLKEQISSKQENTQSSDALFPESYWKKEPATSSSSINSQTAGTDASTPTPTQTQPPPLPPMDGGGPVGPFGGRPLPGNPPPGYPGHIPPPGYPQPPERGGR